MFVLFGILLVFLIIFLDIHLFLFHVALTLNWNKFKFFHLIF